MLVLPEVRRLQVAFVGGAVGIDFEDAVQVAADVGKLLRREAGGRRGYRPDESVTVTSPRPKADFNCAASALSILPMRVKFHELVE